MTIKAVLYARVSTDEQAEKGYSLQSQLSALHVYAFEHGFDVIAEFLDDFTGTVPLELRPEGKKAFQTLKNGQADVLIVYTMDRLVRPPEDGDEWDTPVLIRGLAKLGKVIHTVNRGKLATDFASLLLAMLDAKAAGEERRKIIERTSRGKNTKAKSGKVVGCGHAPYGYKFASSRPDHPVDSLEINETEAKIVRLIFDWYVFGDGWGGPIGAIAIANKLTEMRVPTPNKRKAKYKFSSAGVWNVSQISKMLTNKLYIGEWKYGVRIGTNGRDGIRPESEHIVINVPRIISDRTFRIAQQQRDYNARMSSRNTQRVYLLRGMIHCGCGASFVGLDRKDRGYYEYRCASPSKRSVIGSDERCHESLVRGPVIEELVWKYVLELVTNPETLRERLLEAQKAVLESLSTHNGSLDALEGLIEETEREANEIAAAMPRTHGIVSSKLQEQADKISERHAALCSRRAKIEAEMSEALAGITDKNITDIVEFSRLVQKGLSNPTDLEKRRWLEYLGIEVQIENHHAVVKCSFPVEPGEFDLISSCNCRSLRPTSLRRDARTARTAARPDRCR